MIHLSTYICNIIIIIIILLSLSCHQVDAEDYCANKKLVSIGAAPYKYSAEKCKSECSLMTSCLAYQISADPTSPCWLQTKENGLDDNNFYNPTFQIVEYVKGCSKGMPDYCSNSSFVTVGAYRINEPTMDACMIACNANTRCVSIQIVNNVECWLQTNVNAFDTVYYPSIPPVVEYIKDGYCVPKDCEVEYQITSNLASMYVTLYADITNPMVCRYQCSIMNECSSYQVNGTTCFLQLSTSSTPLTQKPGFKEYKKIGSSCLGCKRSYTMKTSMHTQNPTDFPMINTTEDCQRACNLDFNCLSYQFNFYSNDAKCRLQFNTGTSVVTLLGIKEYIKKCEYLPYKMRACPSVFSKNSTSSSNEATPYFPATTRKKCESACQQNVFCNSYLVDVSGPANGKPFCLLNFGLFNPGAQGKQENREENFISCL